MDRIKPGVSMAGQGISIQRFCRGCTICWRVSVRKMAGRMTWPLLLVCAGCASTWLVMVSTTAGEVCVLQQVSGGAPGGA